MFNEKDKHYHEICFPQTGKLLSLNVRAAIRSGRSKLWTDWICTRNNYIDRQPVIGSFSLRIWAGEFYYHSVFTIWVDGEEIKRDVILHIYVKRGKLYAEETDRVPFRQLMM